jgi:ankyrin repeat protein
MGKRSSKSKTPKAVVKEETAELPYDPFRGSETVTLQELLDDVFYDNLEEGASFTGPNALTVNSGIWADEDRPLHKVARRGNARCVMLLLEVGADPNAKGDLSLSPLYYAISNGHFAVAKSLLEAGARIDIFNEFGYTDLGYCSPNSHSPNPKMFRLLQSYWLGVTPHDARKPKY